ncbi:hypothetical protein AHF37_06997 [Paragonimus kellicotti]|nr:hypothetical protein AHF37_06997 [Paragonimus kellicotti]
MELFIDGRIAVMLLVHRRTISTAPDQTVDSCLEDSQTTLLHLLVANGSNNTHESAQLDLARAILNKSISASAPDRNGRTPLHIALLHNSKAMFDLLLEQPERLDLDATDRLGCPPLWFALMFSNGPPLSRSYTASLIRAGADINFRFGSTLDGDNDHTIEAADYSFPKDGDTLLMACARCGLESGALFLLQPQPNCPAAIVESTNVSGETVYHLAVESKLKSLSHCLATVHRADPNQFRIRTVTTNEPTFTKPIDSSPAQKTVVPTSTLDSPKCVDPFQLFPDDEVVSANGDSMQPVTFENPFDLNSMSERMDPDGQGPMSSTPDSSVVVGSRELPLERFVEEKRTPLHLAMTNGLSELIELYLDLKCDREPDWFLLDENGESVLSLALWSEQFDLAMIGPSDTSANAVLAQFTGGPGATSLLHRAVEHDRLEAVRFLIRHRDDVDHSFCSYRSPCSPKLEDDVLCTNDNSAVDHSSRDTIICPLWTALTWNRLNIADLLRRAGRQSMLLSGCDVNSPPRCPELYKHHTLPDAVSRLQPMRAWTPIHMAAAFGAIRIVQSLLDCGRTDVNCQDADGNTAVHLAVRAGHNELVTRLLRCPVVDCTVKNKLGHTAFHVAMECRNVKAAHALLERDSTLALQTDNLGRNFLHIALQNKDRAAVFFLIQSGMDMNQCVRDSNQHTPLHLAIIAGVPDDVFRSMVSFFPCIFLFHTYVNEIKQDLKSGLLLIKLLGGASSYWSLTRCFHVLFTFTNHSLAYV